MKFKVVTLPNGLIYQGVKSEGEWKERVRGTYEQEGIRFLEKNVRKVDTFIDVGAFCGYYGLHAMKEGVYTIFIEPNLECSKAILYSIASSYLKTAYIVESLAISNIYGTKEFSYGKIAGFLRGRSGGGGRDVVTVPLREYMDFDKQYMIKIDIEGMELEALEGVGLYQEQIKFAIIEFHPMFVNKQEIKKTLELIESYGLEEVWRSGDPFTTNANIHYIRKE